MRRPGRCGSRRRPSPRGPPRAPGRVRGPAPCPGGRAQLALGRDDAPAGCCPGLVTAPLDDVQAAEPAKVFKALGDPVRLRLPSLIASRSGGEVRVCDLPPAFDLSQPTISHHLKLLRQAGLTDCERRGRTPRHDRCGRPPVRPVRLRPQRGRGAKPSARSATRSTSASAPWSRRSPRGRGRERERPVPHRRDDVRARAGARGSTGSASTRATSRPRPPSRAGRSATPPGCPGTAPSTRRLDRGRRRPDDPVRRPPRETPRVPPSARGRAGERSAPSREGARGTSERRAEARGGANETSGGTCVWGANDATRPGERTGPGGERTLRPGPEPYRAGDGNRTRVASLED